MAVHTQTAAGTGSGRLVSGEAVELDVRYARVGSRMLAFLIDVVIQAAVLLVLGLLVAMVIGLLATRLDEDNGLEAVLRGAMVVVLVAAYVALPVTVETLTSGRSAGKLAMGLRVVREDGGPIRFRHALTRNLVGLAVEWPGLLIPPVSWLICLSQMVANPRGRRLGDLAAGTVVIHERTPASWGWVPAMPPQLADWADTLDLTGLDDQLALAVRHYLARNRQLARPARNRLGHALAAEVAARTTPPPPPGTPGWAYLAAVLAERNRRSAARLAARRAITSRIWPFQR